jgi:hypothetical protein
MASLTILNASGDTTIKWDESAFAAGDPSAEEAVAEAERLFAEARAAGAEAFRVRTGQLAQRLTILDPASAEDVLIIPRMVGG